MLAKRIIPCLDVRQGQVVKGVCFRQHRVVGDILELATKYTESGADELVFYDITASGEGRAADTNWINRIARLINIPFCVAGGIRTLEQAENILHAGADKFSINSPALENPSFINACERAFGRQCVVVGVDSFYEAGQYGVYQYTGSEEKTKKTTRNTLDWVREVQDRGAGEIVVNCMNQDGVREGYDIAQLSTLRDFIEVPLIASGGAGACQHFLDVFRSAQVDGALAATVFHEDWIQIPQLKEYLKQKQIAVRV